MTTTKHQRPNGKSIRNLVLAFGAAAVLGMNYYTCDQLGNLEEGVIRLQQQTEQVEQQFRYIERIFYKYTQREEIDQS